MVQGEGITCPFCGAPVNVGKRESVRCEYCGNDVVGKQIDSSIEPPSSIPQKRPSPTGNRTSPTGTTYRIVGLMAVMLIVVGVGAIFFLIDIFSESGSSESEPSLVHCFDSVPEGAKVVHFGKVLGKTHLCVPASGTPRYDIRLEGYHPQQVNLPRTESRNVAVTLVRAVAGDASSLAIEGTPMTVLWSKVKRTHGCDYFSTPEGLGDTAYLAQGDDQVTIEFEGGALFEGKRTSKRLSLTRVSRHSHVSGPWRATETISVRASNETLRGRYSYEECSLTDRELCPGNCRIKASIGFSFP